MRYWSVSFSDLVAYLSVLGIVGRGDEGAEDGSASSDTEPSETSGLGGGSGTSNSGSEKQVRRWMLFQNISLCWNTFVNMNMNYMFSFWRYVNSSLSYLQGKDSWNTGLGVLSPWQPGQRRQRPCPTGSAPFDMNRHIMQQLNGAQ